MKIMHVIVATTTFLLCSCAGLQQFPDSSVDYNKDLPDLDPNYDAALKELYKTGTSAADQKRIRNELIEKRMAVIDVHFREFVTELSRDNATVDLAVALVGVGVGGAGSLVSETASRILSAVSGGLTGAQAAYQKAVLYDKALSALIAQMHAGRKVIATEIFQSWGSDIDTYPLWIAKQHLDAYQFAGSIPGAIVATSADAEVKANQADAILLSAITGEAVTDEAFAKRENLIKRIEGLDATKVFALLSTISGAFPQAKLIADQRYTAEVQAADADGSKAKKLLQSLVPLTAKSKIDIEKWESALGGL